jgi:hypothetical protein
MNSRILATSKLTPVRMLFDMLKTVLEGLPGGVSSIKAHSTEGRRSTWFTFLKSVARIELATGEGREAWYASGRSH